MESYKVAGSSFVHKHGCFFFLCSFTSEFTFKRWGVHITVHTPKVIDMAAVYTDHFLGLFGWLCLTDTKKNQQRRAITVYFQTSVVHTYATNISLVEKEWFYELDTKNILLTWGITSYSHTVEGV